MDVMRSAGFSWIGLRFDLPESSLTSIAGQEKHRSAITVEKLPESSCDFRGEPVVVTRDDQLVRHLRSSGNERFAGFARWARSHHGRLVLVQDGQWSIIRHQLHQLLEGIHSADSIRFIAVGLRPRQLVQVAVLGANILDTAVDGPHSSDTGLTWPVLPLHQLKMGRQGVAIREIQLTQGVSVLGKADEPDELEAVTLQSRVQGAHDLQGDWMCGTALVAPVSHKTGTVALHSTHLERNDGVISNHSDQEPAQTVALGDFTVAIQENGHVDLQRYYTYLVSAGAWRSYSGL